MGNARQGHTLALTSVSFCLICGFGYIKVYIRAAGYKTIYTTYKIIIYKRSTRISTSLLSLSEPFTLALRLFI
jgi:hypothetical protein